MKLSVLVIVAVGAGVSPACSEGQAANTGLGDGNIASILARRIAIIGEAGEQSDSSDAGSEWDDD